MSKPSLMAALKPAVRQGSTASTHSAKGWFFVTMTLLSYRPHPTIIRFSFLLIFCENLSVFASYAMLTRPRNLKTASNKI